MINLSDILQEQGSNLNKLQREAPGNGYDYKGREIGHL